MNQTEPRVKQQEAQWGDAIVLDGPSVITTLRDCGVTHVIWIPDSELGRWEPVLSTASTPQLLRVCREGEAIALAAGLHLGGRHPVVLIQCTGLFEVGDRFRNILHDLHVPLFFVIGVRSYYAHQQNNSTDSCPIFTEPILRAWRMPYVVFDHSRTAADLEATYRKAWGKGQAFAVVPLGNVILAGRVAFS
jgi:sulfopyruvate decarboxylase TPP-binding subunit